ncbi:MAG: alkane 1-monooxygenase [Proteobacteria bacterium SG_bin5]|nr:MAG: alkane 1-monooxygenase [Proteobacteria bacterium SG_bin5]
MTAYSFLDLVPIIEGGSAGQALANAADLAVHAESLGFQRYWIAEHHGMALAGAATAVVIGHVAAATKTIRVGAGGIMLPNHAPLVIAEQFGTLDALFPGRIDLGLGRAPGSDPAVARALRRAFDGDESAFPRDVVELQAYFAGTGPVPATPAAGAAVRLVILGSSLFGAQLAAALGLPFAFAAHFAPDLLDEAAAVYRHYFRASAGLAAPYFICGVNVFGADSDEEAALLASSQAQAFVALRSGRPIALPPPKPGYRESLPAAARAMLDRVLECSAVGGPAKLADDLAAILRRTQADELILSSGIYDHAARKHSLTRAAEAMRALRVAA